MLATLCNNGKRSDIERMTPEAVAALGGLDVLVNNAGIAGLPLLWKRWTLISGKKSWPLIWSVHST
jgi:NAD(P)-dependent dehydrogenase (short-subunit alcohol dehydrogenase family)